MTRLAELVYSITVAYHMFAALAQSVERRLGKAEVGGSIPLGSFETIKVKIFQGNDSLEYLYFYMLNVRVLWQAVCSDKE